MFTRAAGQTILCRRATAVVASQVLITTQAAMAQVRDGSAAGIAKELGPIKFKRFHRSLEAVDKLIFIRHGEKLDEDIHGKTTSLTAAGSFRAENLVRVFGRGEDALLTPDVIYAMKQGKYTDNSNRPYLTVQPLATHLRMDPRMDDRTKTAAGVFDNKYHSRKKLVKNVLQHAKDGHYDDKTLLFCWVTFNRAGPMLNPAWLFLMQRTDAKPRSLMQEHKRIPYIVALLGLHDEQLFWGAEPDSQEDERTNYSAIWVFTPRERTLEVFKQFEVTEELGATEGSGTAALTLLEPPGGYSAVARTLHLNPVPDHGNNDEEGRDDDRDYDDDDDDNQH